MREGRLGNQELEILKGKRGMRIMGGERRDFLKGSLQAKSRRG